MNILNVPIKTILASSLCLWFILFASGSEVSAAFNGLDLDLIKETSESFSLNSLFEIAKEFSIPILVGMVVLSGFSALLGLIFKPLKVVAGSLLGIGLVFFLLVNYAPQIVGIMIAFVRSVMSRITGG